MFTAGLVMGVVPSVFFSSIVVMVVFTSILTPILLKFVYRSDDKYASLEESRISDRSHILEQAETISYQLMQDEQDRMISERDEEIKEKKAQAKEKDR